MTQYTLPNETLLLNADLDQLRADAAHWRALQAGLCTRGYDHITVADILQIFPNFRAMAHADRVDPTAQTPPTRQEAVKKPLTASAPPPAAAPTFFAAADTHLGPCSIGYTTAGELAVLIHKRREVYLLALADLLADLLADITAASPTGQTPVPPIM